MTVDGRKRPNASDGSGDGGRSPALWPPPSVHASLHHEAREGLLVFQRVPGDDLLDGDVGSRQEAHEAHHADDAVLDGHQRGHALSVERHQLQDGREDERQEAAADRAHQRDDQVQLRDQDGEDAWKERRRRR